MTKYNIEIDEQIVEFPHLQNLTLDEAIKLVVVYAGKFTTNAMIADRNENSKIRDINIKSRDSIKIVEAK